MRTDVYYKVRVEDEHGTEITAFGIAFSRESCKRGDAEFAVTLLTPDTDTIGEFIWDELAGDEPPKEDT